jgi:NAD(P)-dependent dehydrogenase (short-subunit alcohol dehydrogenase family)/3-oxoacyl-(acyl-carrier-protein) synthase
MNQEPGMSGLTQDLQGRIALVTGGGKGVGRVVARQLAERGAHVLINCFHSYAQAKETKAMLEALGARADVLRASVAKQGQVDRMFDEIADRFGHLDILVNNAADGWLGPVAELEEEHFARALGTNLLGSFWCARRAAALMAPRGGGCIVNVSSNGAGMVPGNYLAVGASKAAVEAMTRHLAAELAPQGIRVNTASCSLIDGDVANLFPQAEEMKVVTRDSTPLGRLAVAEDLAGVVTFLASDLSRWVTGQVVLADGGLSLGHAMLSAPRPEGLAAPTVEARGDSRDDHDDDINPEEAAANLTAVDLVGDPVVVVGMGLATPGASSPDEYWELAARGEELFVDVPGDRWDGSRFHDRDKNAPDKSYQTRSGFITGFAPEAELAQEIEAGEVPTDETTRWLRHALIQAIRGVGRRDTDRMSFCVGYTADGNQHLEESMVLSGATHRLGERARAAGVPDEVLERTVDALTRHLWRGSRGCTDVLPHRVGQEAMRGLLPEDTELFMVDTACSSSLYAIDVGMKGLLLGTLDVAVCGGAFALGPRGAVLFSKLHGLSVSGAVRSLDKDADGVLFSDGAGVVVLKRLSRALADGDTVLGVLAAVGTSSDGRGKAIYAPSSSGQAIAVERARSAPGAEGLLVDWVVAHATGTTAGDLAEVTTLRTTLGAAAPPGHTIHITSNKSLVGHTGWSAGVVSLIEVLLAMRHDTIPRQHRFQEAPAAFELDGSALRVPTEPVPWPPRADRPRTAAVSGFGFGGTNAHLLVREYDGRGAPVQEMDPDEPVVVVAWSARVPGLETAAEVEEWLTVPGARRPEATFGDAYPAPPLGQVRIPPGTVRSIDRCQLMLLESVLPLRDGLGEFWERSKDRAGVVVGHLGATRNATLYAHRCHLDNLRDVVTGSAPDGWADQVAAVFDGYADEVRRLVPESNENSFPGIMPNVIPARVANYLDLHGVNMTVDTGLASSASAIDVAIRYLRAGDLDLALVAGVNGNSTPEAAVIADRLFGGARPAGRLQVAEGAFTLALVRESTAREHGLQPLARVDTATPGADEAPEPSGPGGFTYLGGDGLVAVLRRVLGAGGVGTTGPVRVSRDAEVRAAVAAKEPENSMITVHRHVPVVGRFPLEQVRPVVPFIQPGTVVLTDDPALLEGIAVPDGAVVVSTGTRPSPFASSVHVPHPTPETVAAALVGLDRPAQHVRLVTDLTGVDDAAKQLPLHDLLFLTLQQVHEGLRRPGATVTVGLLGGWRDGAPHPFAGLWTGLVKSTSVELRSLVACTVLSDTRDAATVREQMTLETSARHFLPVVVYDGGVRRTTFLEPAGSAHPEQAGPASSRGEADSPDELPSTLGPDAVVVAAGGARGIAAEVLVEVARRYRPTIYVLGRSDIPAVSADLPPRADYVREQLQLAPGTSIAALNHSYQRLADAQAARRNLDLMTEHCGPGRVHYLRCDVLDEAQVRSAATAALRESGRVDLLLNVAGINRAADIPSKRWEDFRAVRDLKVLAYRNLTRALGGQVRTWVNFGSIVGFTGQAGETDYAAGNDLLTTAAEASAAGAGRELTIGWCLWRDAGLGADPVKKSFLEKSGIYTAMSSEEGVQHFVRELDPQEAHRAVMLLGESERAALEDYRPGYLTAPRFPVSEPGPGGFMLDRRVTGNDVTAEYERTFDLDRDGYLAEHVVLGHPTLPGTFVTEIAAEAAVDLVPGRVPVAFEDFVLSSFLRVYAAGRPVRKRIVAERLSHDAVASVVRVRVLGDVVAPTGQVLVRDRLHFQVDVRLEDELPPAPYWEPWSEHEDGDAVPDPYHLPNPSALLTDRLVSTRGTRQHALGRRATFDLHIAQDDPAFSRFRVPVVLLDGLLRVSVLDPVRDGHVVLAAPSAIRRIELYTDANDLGLASDQPAIQLYSCPRRLDLEGPMVANRCVAATPDGRMVAQIHDTATAILGYVHIESGRFSTREQLLALQGA